MILTNAPCERHGWPLRECIGCADPPPRPRPPVDDHGLTVDHGDTQTATDLAALAGALAGAIVGGSVLLGYGILERLFRRRP